MLIILGTVGAVAAYLSISGFRIYVAPDGAVVRPADPEPAAPAGLAAGNAPPAPAERPANLPWRNEPEQPAVAQVLDAVRTPRHVRLIKEFVKETTGRELDDDGVLRWHDPFEFQLAGERVQGVRVEFTGGLIDLVYIGSDTEVWGYVTTVELWPHFAPHLIEVEQPSDPHAPNWDLYIRLHADKSEDQAILRQHTLRDPQRRQGFFERLESKMLSALKQGGFKNGTPSYVRFNLPNDSWVEAPPEPPPNRHVFYSFSEGQWYVIGVFLRDTQEIYLEVSLTGRAANDLRLDTYINTLCQKAHPERGLDAVKSVNLRYSSITDRGLRHLRPCTNLEVLDLTGTRITNEAIRHIRRLSNLKQLLIAETRITDGGVRQLEEAIPGVKILR